MLPSSLNVNLIGAIKQFFLSSSLRCRIIQLGDVKKNISLPVMVTTMAVMTCKYFPRKTFFAKLAVNLSTVGICSKIYILKHFSFMTSCD